jgi:hypothetical protein
LWVTFTFVRFLTQSLVSSIFTQHFNIFQQFSWLTTRQKNDQVVAILMKTGLNNALLHTLFIVVNNSQYWTILLHPIQAQQYCSTLLTSVNNVGSKTLFNPVEQRARRFLPCTWFSCYCRVHVHVHDFHDFLVMSSTSENNEGLDGSFYTINNYLN